MKHSACPRGVSGASCVCGVAMREGETILIADMCVNETATLKAPKYLTYHADKKDKNLLEDAGIKVSDAASTFKVSNI